MLQQINNILEANKGRWMGETEIIRAAYPGRRDSQISDAEWQEVIQCLREIKARGYAKVRNIGLNTYDWRAK